MSVRFLLSVSRLFDRVSVCELTVVSVSVTGLRFNTISYSRRAESGDIRSYALSTCSDNKYKKVTELLFILLVTVILFGD